jgi:WD40 repeat protein
VTFETMARMAAQGLRAATAVDADAGLAHLRRTNRRRSAARAATAAVGVAAVVVGIALSQSGTDQTAPPMDRGPAETPDPRLSDGIVHGIGRGPGGTPSSAVTSLPDARSAPYPAWQAFDQDTGRFLFAQDGGPEATADDVRTVRVLARGLSAPVATIHCVEQCNWAHSFGPGQDEVTTLVRPDGNRLRTAQVWGLDDVMRDEIDLSDVLKGRGITDLEWSPDGSQLAVSTFTGAVEPWCANGGPPCEARIWIFDQTGSNPVVAYTQRPSQGDYIAEGDFWNEPMLIDLAWAPDGERLGMVATTYRPDQADRPPTLVALDVESGKTETVHAFDGCSALVNHQLSLTEACYESRLGFAWSADGRRIAVTSGAGIAELSSNGRPLTPTLGSGQGPLAWLASAN